MIFKDLNLEDKLVFDKYLKPYNFKTYEYSFTNLFMWRKADHIQYSIFQEALIIKKRDSSGAYYFMQPIGYNRDNLKIIVDKLIEYIKEYKFHYLFKQAEADFLKDLTECCPNEFSIIEDRDSFDYIYDSSRLINLSGRKIKNQKNHYNNFIKNNVYRITNITEEEVNQCMRFSQQWFDKKGSEEGDLIYEQKAIEELLQYRELFNLKTLAVYVNGHISAFTIGEKINDNMAIIHIEKADSRINGLYNFLNKTFVEEYFSKVPFINREEDLGIDGLRMTKLAYKPVRLECKYNIMLQG